MANNDLNEYVIPRFNKAMTKIIAEASINGGMISCDECFCIIKEALDISDDDWRLPVVLYQEG